MTDIPFTEAIEAQRLRDIRTLIETTLREFDIGASVFLAGRGGRFEVFQIVDPSWSILKLEDLPGGGQGLRARSQAADYAGDSERQQRELEWSCGMVSGLAETMAMTAGAWLQFAAIIDDATGAEHTPLRAIDPREEGPA